MRPIPTCSAFISRGAIAWLPALALLCALTAHANEPGLEVITLQHRAAADLLPLLQPFVAADGVIKGTDDKLIVRTNATNLAELRKLIAELDRPLRRLMIEIKQLSGDSAREDAAAMNNHGAKVWRTEKRDDADRLQQVQVIEGAQAFIDVGRQIPISDFAVTLDRNGTRIEQDTRYVGTTTGFYARPHLSGDTVTLDVSPYQTTTEGSGPQPTFNVQSLRTTITGKLGEWIALGASTRETERHDRDAITYSTSQRGEQDRRIVLRVTVANP